MRRENHGRIGTGRHFAEFLDENGALGAQALDHVAVMHDFVTDIDRGAVKREQRSTNSMARTTPAQKPRGEHNNTFRAGFSGAGGMNVLESTPFFAWFTASTWA